MVDTDRPLWNTPAVRHLDWLCHAQPLINCGPVLATANALPNDLTARLRWLDQHPSSLLNCLEQSASYRLGHYFESLYSFLLNHIFEWPVLLRNTPVRSVEGITLGELDFIVRNAVTGELEHHEVAVKFYLGLHHHQTTHWYGPNARDRLDLKTQRMLTHQCRMTQRPETQAILAAAGLSEPVRPVLVMPGTLFSPYSSKCGPADEPEWVNPSHDSGWWTKHSQLAQLDTVAWTALQKPNWLSRHQQENTVDVTATENALARVARDSRPTLFAAMAERADGRGFEEVSRWFVVPDHWPKPHPTAPDDHHSDHPHPPYSPPAD